jgi:tetratricopeptide (TPR) repeat protein
MKRIEKTVFLSYRRTDAPWALTIFKELKHEGFDVFFDYKSISSGDFETVIIENIRARAHFVLLLTPSALERCAESGDWLMREIETALDARRNIVPVLIEPFDFGDPAISSILQGPLASLKNYNGLGLSLEYFDAAMAKLREHFLNVPLDAVIHPPSYLASRAAKEQQSAATAAPAIQKRELTARQFFERAFIEKSPDEKIRFLGESIRLVFEQSQAYIKEGIAFMDRGDADNAIIHFNEAMRIEASIPKRWAGPDLAWVQLSSNLPSAYNNRGLALVSKGYLDGAIADFNQAMQLDTDFANPIYNRGIAHLNKGDFENAIADFNEAIRRTPDDGDAYGNRGIAYAIQDKLVAAIADFDEAIRLAPNDGIGYFNRGHARIQNGDTQGGANDLIEAQRRGYHAVGK